MLYSKDNCFNEISIDVGVIGIGYAGLPLAVAAAKAGYRTRGLDVNEFHVMQINSCRSPVETVDNAELSSISTVFDATTDQRYLSSCSIIAICVPTPVDNRGIPDLSLLISAVKTVSNFLCKGQLIIVESTVSPGTTEGIVLELLESSGLKSGSDFNLAYSPERIDPGNKDYNFSNTPKIVGGLTEDCAYRALSFYKKLTCEVFLTQTIRAAESAKMLENIYRQVNIALINEFARICEKLDIDVWDTIRAASTKPFGFTPFWPSIGVGGHCIPVDPLYMAHSATQVGMHFRMIEEAQKINDSTPIWVANRADIILRKHGINIRYSTILLLGVTYKPDIADTRNSPVTILASEFLARGANVIFHDPYVNKFIVGNTALKKSMDLQSDLLHADITIIAQPHSCYGSENLFTAKLLLNPTNLLFTQENSYKNDIELCSEGK